MKVIPVNDLSRWETPDFQEILQRISGVLTSGYFMLGDQNRALEQELSERLDGIGVVTLGNGTDALTIAIMALNLPPGSRIVTAANAGGYSTGAVFRTGHQPVFVDVNLENAQMNLQSLENLLESQPPISAVIVTHLYGLMADIKKICALAERFGVKIIEDCAQSTGASLDNRWAGSWGDASTFSFYPTKNLGALGDGGAVAIRDEKSLARARQLAQYGWSDRYVVAIGGGFNSRLDEIQAAILLYRLLTLDEQNSKRRSIVRRYAEVLSAPRRMLWADNESYVGHLAVMVTPNRKTDRQKLLDDGVGTGTHYPVLDNQQPAWKDYFLNVFLPSSDELVESIVTLPCFPSMTKLEIDQVCRALSKLL